MPFKQHDRQYDLVVFGATGLSAFSSIDNTTVD